jgi:hypothetical protein
MKEFYKNLSLFPDLSLLFLPLFSVLDAEFGPWLMLKTLRSDFFFAIFTVTVSAFVDPIEGGVDATKFSELAVSNGTADLFHRRDLLRRHGDLLYYSKDPR